MIGALLRRLIKGAAEPATLLANNGGGARGTVMGGPSAAWFGGGYPNFAAENLAAVVSAVTLISRSIGSLPWLIYQETAQGRVERPDHPIARLLRRPDGTDGILTLADMAETWVSSALLFGNGLLAIEDGANGSPTRLKPIPWNAANPTIGRSGRVVFNVAGAGLPWWPSGSSTAVSSSDVLWLRDRTDTSGVYGRSALSRAPSTLAIAHQSQSFAQQTFAAGAKLSGVLKHPAHLSKEASDNLARSWKDSYAGPPNAGGTVVLEEGMDFLPLAMTLEDAQLLLSRKFETEEIARLFNIPLPLLNIWDHSTFTNSDTASQWFGQLTLAPWCRKIELEFSRTLFNDPSYHLEIDLSALMRGSFASRIQSEIAMVRAGVLSQDEMREIEGWPRRGGSADQLQPQAVGGRPAVPDGAGDTLPAPGAANGALVQ